MGMETESETGSRNAPNIPPKIVQTTARAIISGLHNFQNMFSVVKSYVVQHGFVFDWIRVSIAHLFGIEKRKRNSGFPLFLLYIREQNYKPGSVFDSHLSRRTVAGTLKPPRERPGKPWGRSPCSHTGVAPDRVYSDGLFPAIECALTALFHPYRQGYALAVSRFLTESVAAADDCNREEGPFVPLHTTPLRFPLGERSSTPASYQHGAALAAVYLCCTFPEVAFGGRYPLSLPYGARTFLTEGSFAPSARLSVFLAGLLYAKQREKSMGSRSIREDQSLVHGVEAGETPAG